MTWTPLGRIFSPQGQAPWMMTHASLPLAQLLQQDRVRVYFASRDDRNRSHVGALEFALGSLDQVIDLRLDPVLSPGPLGCFDDHGVYPSSLVAVGSRLYLYYIGWNPGARPPLFYSSIGLAVSDDHGKTFHRLRPDPIMARSRFDPCLVTSPCVVHEDSRWRMWYVSGFKWEEGAAGLESYYHIKYAESEDGVEWRREGRVAIDLRPGERNIARPTVLREEDGTWRMWYSFNEGTGYRIGSAESVDGLEWVRHPEAVDVPRSVDGWDSDAQAYPWVFDCSGQRYLLYNGNGFGRDGFGLAIGEGHT